MSGSFWFYFSPPVSEGPQSDRDRFPQNRCSKLNKSAVLGLGILEVVARALLPTFDGVVPAQTRPRGISLGNGMMNSFSRLFIVDAELRST